MAYFTELDDDNYVIRVISINNEDILDEDNNESEDKGIEICISACGPGRYVQTSRNTKNNVHYDPDTWTPDGGVPFRRNFGDVGFLYSDLHDCFLPPPPEAWYELDENLEWVCPSDIGPKTGQPFTHEELLYIGHLVNTSEIYSLVPLSTPNEDPLSTICSTTEFAISDITEITHGVNTHTWFYLDEQGNFNIDYQDDYSIELDLSPVAVITRFSLKTDIEKSNAVSKFCYEQHPQNESFSIHECFRMIIEWAFSYTDLNNSEPMAELAHNFLRCVQMPLNVRNELINSVESQVVGLYLTDDDIYKPFYRTEKTEMPTLFSDWYQNIKNQFPARETGDALPVDLNSLPASYPK